MAAGVAGVLQAAEPATPSATVIEAINRGVSCMGQYLYDDAVKAFEEAAKAGPGLSELSINLAIARFNRSMKENRDIETAEELLDAVLKNEPGNVRALYFKSIILQHLGQAEKAVPLLEKVIQQRPGDGAAHYLLAICKQRSGQNAESELERAIALRPYLTSAYYRLWQSLQLRGQAEKAAPYLEKFKQLRETTLSEIIEFPQYNQMGELALARPLPVQNTPPITKSAFTLRPAQTLLTWASAHGASSATSKSGNPLGGFAVGDVTRDGLLDLIGIVPGTNGQSRLILLSGDGNGQFHKATNSGLESIQQPVTCALGDFDNDERLDLFVGCTKGQHLLQGQSNAVFLDVTPQSGINANSGSTGCVLWIDADHDGDLDLLLGCSAPAGNQLWRNNADGTFTNVIQTNLVHSDAATVAILPGDIDEDRDLDLVVLCAGQPVRIFLNDLLGNFHEGDPGTSLLGDRAGVLQDFNGDGRLDLLTLGGQPAELRLYVGEGRGRFRPDPAFAQCAKAAASWGPIQGIRAMDLDLDSDLDVAVFAQAGHVLYNDGAGRFVLQTKVWPQPANEASLMATEVMDLDGDFVPDLLSLETGAQTQITLTKGILTPPSTAIGINATGVRSRDKRTRSPSDGFGTIVTVRAGLREQKTLHCGLTGGPCQSSVPLYFGLGGKSKADYVHLIWPDAVAQVEIGLPAGQIHKVAETQRKISSCPVLFTWNGQRFEFITDFAGVGGLGYFVGLGEYAQPQPLEHIKIERNQLEALDGKFELRITEPMEETAYIDKLELQVIDHPSGWQVFPDERLVVSGSPPTHKLLAFNHPIYPQHAWDPTGRDCTARLARTDRNYAYTPPLDRRFFGFCQSHTLELDFGAQLASIDSTQSVYLFLNGFLEYPYSQTAYAAGQANTTWQPIRIDRQQPDASWQTVVPDAGAFGGMARTMTVDLTGLIQGPSIRLRLTSNLEIYYDQAFLAIPLNHDLLKVHSIPVATAVLQRVGFAREFSPDGQYPLIYDYQHSELSAPFHVLKGAYTRYGSVTPLLLEFDDQYALVGPGDEIAIQFNASSLPSLKTGMDRSFVLIAHSWCKDMDLYTAAPQTLEPLPFRGMSRYPYPNSEQYPTSTAHRTYREIYNTRIIE